MQNQQQGFLPTLIPLIIIFAVFLLRMRRMGGVRPMSLTRLWVRPVIVVIVAALVLYTSPPQSVVQALVLLVVLGAGIAGGWHQAKLVHISVNTEDGTLQVKYSAIAQAIFIGVILVRVGLRSWLTGSTSPVHAYAAVVTDAFILFFVGFACAQATEMFIRARALLRAPASAG
jgi:hypothetical protein